LNRPKFINFNENLRSYQNSFKWLLLGPAVLGALVWGAAPNSKEAYADAPHTHLPVPAGAYLGSAGEEALNGVGLTFTCNAVILANFFLQTMC
jgi:hypothetical protein